MLKRCLGIVALVTAAVLAVSAWSRPDVRARIEALIGKSGADVAVAFRTLDGRDELLIQPDVDYHAASTMKVPVLVELFRQARAGTLKLDDCDAHRWLDFKGRITAELPERSPDAL